MEYISPKDSCIVYMIPAIEAKNGYQRNITIILDKDGDWFIDYTGIYESKKELYKTKK